MGPCSKQRMALGSGMQGRKTPILSPPSSALCMPLHPHSLPQQVLALSHGAPSSCSHVLMGSRMHVRTPEQ